MKKQATLISLSCLLFISTMKPATTNVPFDLFRKLLPSDATVVEAGGHFGQDTVWMSEMFYEGTVHTFEPTPDLFKKICDIVSEKNNVKVYPLALAHEPGTATFYIDDGNGGANSLLKHTNYFKGPFPDPIQVECVTLDSWAEANNIKKIDFIWFDLEGNELNALKGGSEILKTVTAIYTEINMHTFWKGCCSYQELKAWLAQKGFKEVWKEVVGLQGNALFVKEK